MLYNGNRTWTAADNIKDLIKPHPFLETFYPDFKYFKIIENDYSHDDLLKIKNIVSALFLLETHEKEQYATLIGELEELIARENAQTTALFAQYLKHMLNNEKITPDMYTVVKNVSNKKEAKSMLVTTLQNIKEEGRQEGRHESAFETARKMLDKGLVIELIAEVTGLSDEQIHELQEG